MSEYNGDSKNHSISRTIITQKTRNVATRNTLNPGGEHRRSGRVTVHSPYVTPDQASDKLGYKMPVLLWLNIFYFHLS